MSPILILGSRLWVRLVLRSPPKADEGGFPFPAQKMRKPFLSVIVPLYNEESRIHHLENIYRYLKTQNFKSELIAVNDGSIDQTKTLMVKFSRHFPLKIISYTKNQGKGYAVRKGMLVAKGKYLIFTDIDLSVPIIQIKQFLKYVQKNPIVIGSRNVKGALVKNNQPWLRQFFGNFYIFISNLLFGLNFSDYTCGFKLFSNKAGKDIFRQCRTKGWAFDTEIMVLAKRLGFYPKEVPVIWQHHPLTKVVLPKDIFRTALELGKIKIRFWSNL
ncbi:glycosyltransferase family 2 protein [Candidatus Gottesmanbacteria bacterium]|nr:glycosyltransferase family 2 protein [Candidatus Gottesmanbacteria bacterium]